MPKMFAVLALVGSLGVPTATSGKFEASMDEAHIATTLSQQIDLLEICGMQAALGDLPARLRAFESSHQSAGHSLSSDMQLAVLANRSALVSQAGGKDRFCAGLKQFGVARAADGIKQGWINLSRVHASSKTAGHN